MAAVLCQSYSLKCNLYVLLPVSFVSEQLSYTGFFKKNLNKLDINVSYNHCFWHICQIWQTAKLGTWQDNWISVFLNIGIGFYKNIQNLKKNKNVKK